MGAAQKVRFLFQLHLPAGQHENHPARRQSLTLGDGQVAIQLEEAMLRAPSECEWLPT